MSTDAPAAPAAPAPAKSFEQMATEHFKAPEAATPVTPVAPPAPEAKPIAESKTPVASDKTPAAEKKTVSIHDKIAAKKETPATPAEPVDPFAHIAPEKDMSEKSLTGWKALKTEATQKVRAAEQELAAARAQIETFRKATPAESQEIERLKTEHKAALDRLAVLDLQNHPDFTRQYVEPKKKALTEATEVLQYNGKESVDVSLLLSKNPKDFAAAVSEITKDMNQMDATTVQTSLRSAYKLSAEEKSALSKGSELQQQIQQREAMKAKQAFEETFSQFGPKDLLIEAVEIPDDATPEEKAEIETMNREFSSVKQTAESLAFGKLDEKGVARIALEASLYRAQMKGLIPRMNTEYQKVVRERNQLADELKSIRASKGSGQFTGDSGGRGNAPSNETPEQMATRMFSQTP